MSYPIVAVTGLNRGDNPQPGYSVIRSLRRRFPGMTILGLIYDALESGVFAPEGPDWAYTLPYPTSGSAALLDRLDFILTKHRVQILIPTLDAEIEPLIRLNKELADRGVQTFLPTLESFRARAKTELGELCKVCGCTTPRSELAWDVAGALRAAAKLDFPVMLKGQFYDAQRANDEDELANAFHAFVRVWGVPLLVQEYISGGEFNVLGVGDGRGGVTGLCCLRKTVVSSKGKGLGGVVVREPRLEKITAKIVKHLQWRGPFELELMHDEGSDTFRVIELNPRFPAWVDFLSALGLNFPAQIVSLLTDSPVDLLPETPVGRFFLRHQIEVIGSMDELAQLTTDGIWQAQRSKE